MVKKPIFALFILGLIVCTGITLIVPVHAAENSAKVIPDAGGIETASNVTDTSAVTSPVENTGLPQTGSEVETVSVQAPEENVAEPAHLDNAASSSANIGPDTTDLLAAPAEVPVPDAINPDQQMLAYPYEMDLQNLPAQNTVQMAANIRVSGTVADSGWPILNRVMAGPDASFTGTPASGSTSTTVGFTDTSQGNPTGWAWFFGDESYRQQWTEVTHAPLWGNRSAHTSVVMPDGSLILMGGWRDLASPSLNDDVWRSVDSGKTWTQQTAHAPWGLRFMHSSVAMPDGSILLMGGVDYSFLKNDIWISRNNGTDWTQVAQSGPRWSPRSRSSTIVMPDGSIVLMGGWGYNRNMLNDVWRSTDSGQSWTLQTEHAQWPGRGFHASVVMPDGSIILMGGRSIDTQDISTDLNDVWRSTDYGITWNKLSTTGSRWSPRSAFPAVVMPDSSIVLMGGYGTNNIVNNDTWRSTDSGRTWTQIQLPGWSARGFSTGNAMPNGNIVLLGGRGSLSDTHDVWNVSFAGSNEKNPVHSYTGSGPYTVSLSVSNSTGYSVLQKSNYVPTQLSNIVAFGTLPQPFSSPSRTDRELGGTSAIRRDGSIESFIPAPSLTGTDWVAVTNGAALKQNGMLAAWTPGTTTVRWNPGGSYRYVAASQWRDWLLTIYLDANNQSRLMPIANPGSSPEVFGSVPTGTGWKKVAAGNSHALALKDDGTLVAWGKNNYGQLGLPANIKYRDIDAGDDFSLALSIDGTIYAAGKNTYNQVSAKPVGTGFIAIEAGASTAAALGPCGRIKVWGYPLPGTPTNDGYTDIALGPGYAFALKEQAPEVKVTTPLSPNQNLQTVDGTDVSIPPGASFDHTHNGVVRVFAPDGHELLFAFDRNATPVRFPAGAVLPLSVVHTVPSGATVDGTVNYRALVTTPGTTGSNSASTFMNVSEDSWYDDSDPSLPQTLPKGFFFQGLGVSAGTSTKQQVFITNPTPVSASDIPVFSARQLADNTWVGTMSVLTSAGTLKTGTTPSSVVVKKNRMDPNQQINFSILSEKWGYYPGTNLYITEWANLSSTNAVLNYASVATSSLPLASFTITPRIWRQEATGDVLVYSGAPTSCTNNQVCSANGSFVPHWDFANATGTYFANITTLYTLPSHLTAGNPAIPSTFGIIDPSGNNTPVQEVIVTGPLSPVPPGTKVSAENANNTVPWGGTVEHGLKDGVPMTVVYDASGNAKSTADDTKATNISVPGGRILPGTRVHDLPDNAVEDVQGDVIAITPYAAPNTAMLTIHDNVSASYREKLHSDRKNSGVGEYVWPDVYIEGFSKKITNPSTSLNLPP